MTLATLDRITFYSSKDLKNWTKESEFGKEFGAHGGVWECPDLFTLDYDGQPIWVLLVSINPGGPNGGSATQYFTGEFDGDKFIPFRTETSWIDYGPDNYAGITWSNTRNRKIFLGWMSNWQYANVVPTQKWRSAMTAPRDIGIEKVGEKFVLASKPISELAVISEPPVTIKNIDATNYNLTEGAKYSGPAMLHLSADKLETFSITFSNAEGEKLIVGYDKAGNNYYIDRSNSGKINFEKGFAKRHTAPRISDKSSLDLTLIVDDSSIELFADDGLSVMTSIFFPNENYSRVQINSTAGYIIKSLQVNKLKSIWR